MSDRAKGLMSSGLPWSREARWQIIAFEAVVLIGVGAFMLIDNDAAGEVVLQLIGVVLLIACLMLAAGTLRNSEARLGVFDAFRSGVGAAVGMIATASWWSDYIGNPAVRMILGWGLVAYSLLHIVGMIVVRGRESLRPSVISIVALALVLGLLLLTSDDTTSASRINLLGTIFLVFGMLLAALAYYLYRRERPTAPHPAST
jgi:uncharacterized membrane protein HdeD (DUF308 family)